MRVYLDNCCYNRPYDNQSQIRIHLETEAKLHIQEMIKDGDLELVISFVLIYENERNRVAHKRKAISEFMNVNGAYYVSSTKFRWLLQANLSEEWRRRKMYNTVEIMDTGFSCLIEKMGIINAERFIALIKSENFDYTVWQRDYFDKMKPGQIWEEAVEYEKTHPYKGRAIVL